MCWHNLSTGNEVWTLQKKSHPLSLSSWRYSQIVSRDDIKILTAWFSLKVASHIHTNGDFYCSFDETMVISKNVYLQLIKARLWKLTTAVVYDVNWVKTEKALLSFLLNFGILSSQFNKSYILLELWTSLSSLWLRSCTQERNTVKYVSRVKATISTYLSEMYAKLCAWEFLQQHIENTSVPTRNSKANVALPFATSTSVQFKAFRKQLLRYTTFGVYR